MDGTTNTLLGGTANDLLDGTTNDLLDGMTNTLLDGATNDLLDCSNDYTIIHDTINGSCIWDWMGWDGSAYDLIPHSMVWNDTRIGNGNVSGMCICICDAVLYRTMIMHDCAAASV